MSPRPCGKSMCCAFGLGRRKVLGSPAGIMQMCCARVPLDIAELAALELGKLAARSPDSQGAMC